MFLSTYHFDGPGLVPAYDRLRQHMPSEALMLHLCAVGENGLTVLDACPDRATFTAFSRPRCPASAVASSGPTPGGRATRMRTKASPMVPMMMRNWKKCA